jgi:outer membrane protein TolC
MQLCSALESCFRIFFFTSGEIMKLSSVIAALCCLPLVLTAEISAQGTPLPFRTAIELALKNSAATGIARADVQRAQAHYFQARDLFLPQVSVGLSPGFSYGFPLSIEGSAPSLFDVYTQQFLVNFPQRLMVRAAKSDIQATEAQSADRRNDVIVETAVDYIQLDLLESSLSVQKEQQQLADKLEEIVNQRVQAGVDATMELTRAKLAAARTGMQIADTVAAVDQLRLRLSQLTGLPQAEIQTSTESIPEFPPVSQDRDLTAEAAANNPAIKVADQAVQAKTLRAKGEEKQFYPSVDLVTHYALLAEYNNYDKFFKSFQRNNVVVGVAIRFPFFNSSQRESAKAAEADALKARKEAQAVREQVSTETLRLQRSVAQLSAARDVYKLEHQLAQSDTETARERIQAGGATLKDEQSAMITEHERYAAYLNSNLDLEKTQIQLLRQIGQLESWALGPKK